MGMFEKLFGRQRRVTEDNATVELPIPRGPALQVGNVQGVGARERQEDSFAICNVSDPEALAQHGLFAVVADGMGGSSGAAAAPRRWRCGSRAADSTGSAWGTARSFSSGGSACSS